jgi:hypothetical protein
MRAVPENRCLWIAHPGKSCIFVLRHEARYVGKIVISEDKAASQRSFDLCQIAS